MITEATRVSGAATGETATPQRGGTLELVMYRVCWASVFSAACGHGDPMSRDLAEFRAHDEAMAHPFRRYWVEACKRRDSGVPVVTH